MRDFNAVRISSERLGNDEFEFGIMEDFNLCLEETNVEDHPSKWFFYTWCNKRESGDRKSSRIANEAWFSKFRRIEIELMGPGTFDHYPIHV